MTIMRSVSAADGAGRRLAPAMAVAWLLLACAAWLAALPLPAAQAAGEARLVGVRLIATGSSGHGGVPGVQVVLETSRAVSFDAGVQAGPLRLEIVVPGLKVAPRVRQAGRSALLGTVSWRQVAGGVLVSVPLRTPALIVDAHAERAARGRAARLVVHLARTDVRTLARLLDVPAARLQQAPASPGAAAQATPGREETTVPAGDAAALAAVQQAYRRLVEQAAATPMDIGELISALPLEFATQEPRAERRRQAPQPRREGRNAAGKAVPRQPPRPAAAARPVIVVDAGHGGRDPGAIGPRGVKEKDIVLRFARELRDALERRGYVVVMTRTGDTFLRLRQRVQVARAHHAALFVSIHVDKFRKPGVSGLGIYTLSEEASDADAAELARMENAADLIGAPEDEIDDDEVRDILVELTQRETNANSHLLAMRLVKALKGVVRLRRNPVRSAAFRVLRAPEIPSLLVELGYITNPGDVRNMLSAAWRRKVASRMAATIDAVLKTRLALR